MMNEESCIKVTASLMRHKKLFRLARTLGIKHEEAFYILVTLWLSAAASHPDGRYADAEEIAFSAGLKDGITADAFLQALLTCGSPGTGFIEPDPDGHGYRIHDWEHYVVTSKPRQARIKTTAIPQKLKGIVRAETAVKQETVIIHDETAASVEDSGDGQKQLFDVPVQIENNNRGAKNKAKSKDKSSKTQKIELTIEFTEVWKIYPRKKNSGKQRAYDYYVRLRIKEGVSSETLKNAVEGYRKYVKAKGLDEQYIMMGSTFFGPDGRWKDFVEDNDEPLQAGGLVEPRTSNEFDREQYLIETVFGGNRQRYVQWITDGSPEPASEWIKCHS